MTANSVVDDDDDEDVIEVISVVIVKGKHRRVTEQDLSF
jgi:hypothetical protein